jgi:glucose/arabinose dehydrogenase
MDCEIGERCGWCGTDMKFALSLWIVAVLAWPLVGRGQATADGVFVDWNQERPGVAHRVTLADLPAPAPNESVGNHPRVVPRPANAWPIAPPGFKVTLYAGGDAASPAFQQPRLLRTAPNGDLFLADSAAGAVFVLRGVRADGKASLIERFAGNLDHPFGIAFYPADHPKFLYVANATTIVRFPYAAGDVHASSEPETLVADIPGYARLAGGGHWTRDIVFSKDGAHLLVSVGSGSNVDNPDDHPREFHRADILEYTPEGKLLKVYAYGLRNCVGEAINPVTGALWCSTNERDALGNHLVPDYVTSVPEGAFFGWPWYYMGGHQDPRLPEPCADGTGPDPQLAAESPDPATCRHVDLHALVRTPDVLLQPHMASLEMTFYPESGEFPREYAGNAFVAEHGSWNRAKRAGYEVIRIPIHDGNADGSYEDFLTGFVVNDESVWGRPVGVAVANDGSLFVSDDGSRSVWHITYAGHGARAAAGKGGSPGV